jgi:hypothetical protein
VASVYNDLAFFYMHELRTELLAHGSKMTKKAIIFFIKAQKVLVKALDIRVKCQGEEHPYCASFVGVLYEFVFLTRFDLFRLYLKFGELYAMSNMRGKAETCFTTVGMVLTYKFVCSQ